MKKIISFLILIFLIINQTYSYNYYFQYGQPDKFQNKLLKFWDSTCENISEADIPTIFIPWILASWYSEEWFKKSKIKRWIPDPVTHSYDTLFYTFKQNWYELKDVFYEDEYNVYIEWNPKKSLYLFWYDWKKDNKITATLLNQLISKIRQEYITQNKCDIWKVNIIAHSMWWLVARAMLEDMCISDTELEDYKKITQSNWLIKSFKSTACSDQTKINKLITISTPQRWSPRSLPMWEKWNISEVEDIMTSLWLKSQFSEESILNAGNYLYDQQLYERIHWYETWIPNWMVTIWQLLPDIKNKNSYNEKLKYLFKDHPYNMSWDTMYSSWTKYYLANEFYPQNSFLEELNKEKNINKMWDKISNKYTSYYSIITWNYKKNNIVSFQNWDYYWKWEWVLWTDLTWKIKSKDIYNTYNKSIDKSNYSTSNIVRDESWLWWDWTVPKFNLMLVPNDSISWKQVQNTKFQSIEIKCYDDLLKKWKYENLWEIENALYKNIWKEDKLINILPQQELSACSHTKTPISTSIQVFNNIFWKKINLNIDWIEDMYVERNLLLNYIWHTEYEKSVSSLNNTASKLVWISNYYKIDNLFNEYKYKKVLTQSEIQKDNQNKPINVSLDFGWEMWKLIRYEVLSPINITITDSLWRKIWINPETWMIENEIPGAWTSWNTEGSGEPEFFLIPVTWTWEIKHEIKTYWTWNWEYHIVMEEIDLTDSNTSIDSSTNSTTKNQSSYLPFSKGVVSKGGGIIIKWNVKNNFWEDYLVNIDSWKTEFKNLSENISATLEINNTDIQTIDDNYKVRYSVRWKSEKVDKIRFILYRDGKKIVSKDKNIDWEIDLGLTQEWYYVLKVGLVDIDWKVFRNSESMKELRIKKVKNIEDILAINQNTEVKSFDLDKNTKDLENNSEFEKKYWSKLLKIKFKIDNNFSQKQKERLKKIFVNWRDWFLNRISDINKKAELEYIIDKIISFL